MEPIVSEFQPNAFSDELDLYPKILQDVQRALQLQSRRRDRRSNYPGPLDGDTTHSTNVIDSVLPHASSSTSAPIVRSISDHLQALPLPSDVDFSPFTRSVPPHPVPLSSNGGATLDWAGSQSEDEKPDRLWTIHRGKRKGKEKAQPSNRAVIEKQEALFIGSIKAEAPAATIRKASIVKEQLGRQYSITFGSLASGDPINLCQVVRWYSNSTSDTRIWLDNAEPLMWLKHLLDHRRKDRSKWHISALLMEEYLRSRKSAGQGQSLHPVSAGVVSSNSPSRTYPGSEKQTVPFALSPDSSPSTSASGIRSAEGHISFGPLVNHARDSPDNSQSHEEGKVKGWRQSLPGFFESASSHVPTFPYNAATSPGGLSPANSRLNFPIVHRFRRRADESDEGSNSVLGSQSEDQNDSGPDARRRSRGKREPRSIHSNLQPPRQSTTELNNPCETSDSQLPAAPGPASAEIPLDPVVEPQISLLDEESNEAGSKPSSEIPVRRSYRSTSLPLSGPIFSKADLGYEEDKLEMEYDHRSRMLEEMKAHNHRLRHRMQRIAADVREYDILCSNTMPTLGIPYRNLPPELLDAIGHDPSAVTGGTRRYHGWQAVEDIYERIIRQREVIRQFLSLAGEDNFSTPDVLDQPITSLMKKLETLEQAQYPLREKADEVNKILAEVRSIHGTVKQEYNNALSQTSVVYPELSHIIALVEKYQDPYQQIWEIGMDTLTFILDTITPFWRNYGKTIGEDIQDFLIIPWYRNEFTGEAKWYPVESLPRRPVYHWLALLALSTVTVLVTFLQARAAITSTWHYRLLWIDSQGLRWTVLPFFWAAIVIQWFAVIIELCVVFLQAAVATWWLGWFVGVYT
ncbi:hypothetical protein J3A83DRAFT_4094948 [Scleroderma citrinum]